MIARLRFNLDKQEDREAHVHALNGIRYYCRIEEALNMIRKVLKHGPLSEEERKYLEELRSILTSGVSDLGVE